MIGIDAVCERWPTKAPFKITGYTFGDCEVVLATLTADGVSGSGEAFGVYYHDETPSRMAAEIRDLAPLLEGGISREELRARVPAGGVRNAIDCALWDLEAQRSGTPAFVTAGLSALTPLKTTYTVGAGSPNEMALAAKSYAPAPMLKLKLTGEDDAARLAAVRAARPDAWIGVDANQGFTRASLEALMPVLVALQVSLIEQPVPVGQEESLRNLHSPIPLAADESVQSFADIARLHGIFDVINIKLDKCGGLTEALTMIKEVRRLGMKPMVGCMQASSLGIAPAYLAGQFCDYVDLDAAMFLTRDREPSFVYADGVIYPQQSGWGTPRS
jgi:L-alanine-DL-glutamate epimerase-like enolase superfamily enzyme